MPQGELAEVEYANHMDGLEEYRFYFDNFRVHVWNTHVLDSWEIEVMGDPEAWATQPNAIVEFVGRFIEHEKFGKFQLWPLES